MKLLFFSAMLVPMCIFSLYKYTLVHAYTHTKLLVFTKL